MHPSPLVPGQILAGKYRIERVLGAGAMGLVLAATHLQLDAPVAIKVLFGGGKNGREREERFLREARVASKLRSLHVAKVLDLGRTDEDAPYLVMEFLPGEDLGAHLGRRGPLPLAEAVDFVLQACEGLSQAHAAGIVHRDIKPANLFLTRDVSGRPLLKIVDFGIAKKPDDDVALTKTGAALGSPLYMAPEQMRGSRDVDARADVWALGVTLYQLLTGAVPFHGETITEVCTRVVMEPPTPITRYRPDVPGGLAAIIEQCFQKSPDMRWPNVSSFAAALAPYAPASAWLHIERAAGTEHVDAIPSRPTTEIARPAAEVIRAEEQRVAVVPMVPARVVPVRAEVVPREAAPPQRAARSYPRGALAALALVAIAMPVGLFLGLRARGGDVKAEPVASTASTTAASVTTAASEAPSASATATATAATTSAAALPTATASARPSVPRSPVPRSPAPSKPPAGLVGGERR